MPTKTRKRPPIAPPILSLRTHQSDEVNAIKESIAINGVLVPIVVDEEDRLPMSHAPL